jgi:hypothetical protein
MYWNSQYIGQFLTANSFLLEIKYTRERISVLYNTKLFAFENWLIHGTENESFYLLNRNTPVSKIK